jgi:hypothetical protein
VQAAAVMTAAMAVLAAQGGTRGLAEAGRRGRGFQLPYRRIAASPHLLLMCVLGPLSVLQVVALSACLDEISLLAAPSCPKPKANHFLVHLALLAGPGALSRPATAQNSLGVAPPPPLRRCAAPWLGYAQPEAQIKAPPSAEDRG